MVKWVASPNISKFQAKRGGKGLLNPDRQIESSNKEVNKDMRLCLIYGCRTKLLGWVSGGLGLVDVEILGKH